MRGGSSLLIAMLVLAGCAGVPSPSTSPPPTATPSPAPTASLDTTLFQPLMEGLGGPPLGGPSVMLSAETQRSLAIDPSVGYAVEIGHCGLNSPIDFDGSLWDTVGAHNGRGGHLSDDQLGELVNATTMRIFLLDEQHGLLVTPRNAFVLLVRHVGPREYGLCD